MTITKLGQVETGSSIEITNENTRDIFITPFNENYPATGNVSISIKNRSQPFVIHNQAFSRYTVDNNRPRTSYLYSRKTLDPYAWDKTLVKAGGYTQVSSIPLIKIDNTNQILIFELAVKVDGLDVANQAINIVLTPGDYTIETLATELQTQLRANNAFVNDDTATEGKPSIAVTAGTDVENASHFNQLRFQIGRHGTDTINMEILFNEGAATGHEALGLASHSFMFGNALTDLKDGSIDFYGADVPNTFDTYDGYATAVQLETTHATNEFRMIAPKEGGVEVGGTMTIFNNGATNDAIVRINDPKILASRDVTKGGIPHFSSPEGSANYKHKTLVDNLARVTIGSQRRVTLTHFFTDEQGTGPESFWIITSTSSGVTPKESV